MSQTTGNATTVHTYARSIAIQSYTQSYDCLYTCQTGFSLLVNK